MYPNGNQCACKLCVAAWSRYTRAVDGGTAQTPLTAGEIGYDEEEFEEENGEGGAVGDSGLEDDDSGFDGDESRLDDDDVESTTCAQAQDWNI